MWNLTVNADKKNQRKQAKMVRQRKNAGTSGDKKEKAIQKEEQTRKSWRNKED